MVVHVHGETSFPLEVNQAPILTPLILEIMVLQFISGCIAFEDYISRSINSCVMWSLVNCGAFPDNEVTAGIDITELVGCITLVRSLVIR